MNVFQSLQNGKQLNKRQLKFLSNYCHNEIIVLSSEDEKFFTPEKQYYEIIEEIELAYYIKDNPYY